MNKRNLIILTLEGLATSALGCYGSSWNATPSLDAIASVGCVWDQCIASSDDPIQTFCSWFSSDSGNALDPWCKRGRVEFISDDPRLTGIGGDCGFDQTFLVDSLVNPGDHPAQELEQTAFGQLIAAAVDRGCQPDPWSLLWLHSRFLTACWDAPRSLADSHLADFSTEPTEGLDELETPDSIPSFFSQTDPPEIALDETSHADLVTSWMTTYGIQIQLVDDLLAVLLQTLDVSNSVVIVAGTSGFSLGQNGWIGHRVGPLRSCHTRLPLIVGCDGPLRWPRIIPDDVIGDLIRRLANDAPTISPENWIEQDQEFDPRLVTHGSDQVAVTTSRWFLVRESAGNRRLFLKPDDAEDFNDVSRLRTDVADRLASDLTG